MKKWFKKYWRAVILIICCAWIGLYVVAWNCVTRENLKRIGQLEVMVEELKIDYEKSISDLAAEIIALKKENKQLAIFSFYSMYEHYNTTHRYYGNLQRYTYGLNQWALERVDNMNKKIGSLPMDTLRIGNRDFGFKYSRINRNNYRYK